MNDQIVTKGVDRNLGLCITCINEWIQAKKINSDRALVNQAPDPLPEVSFADTHAPSWQSQMVPGVGMVLQLAALPSCVPHLTVVEESAEEKAMKGGLLLGGPGGLN